MTTSIGRPSTPPAAFLMFATISTASRMLAPWVAALPDMGPNAPILIGPRDCAQPAEPEAMSAVAEMLLAMKCRRLSIGPSLSRATLRNEATRQIPAAHHTH